jgi:hypothetical protein
MSTDIFNRRAWLDTVQAAQYLDRRPSTLAQWRWRGDTGPAWVKLGGAVRYNIEDLNAFVEASRHDPSQKSGSRS